MQLNSKILITGSNGFLGKHVSNLLRRHGYSNLLVPSSLSLDLTHEDSVIEYFKKYQPEYVVHLAGNVGGIGKNADVPGILTIDNLRMGLNIIDVAHRFNVKKLLVTGSVCGYAANSKVPFKEEDFIEFNRYGPGMPETTNSGYGLAKRMLYEVLRNFNKQYGFKFVYLIPVNLVGEHDHFDLHNSHVIPALIRKFYEAILDNKESVTLWGNGSPTREFLYAGDCAEAIVLALENYEDVYPLNIGTGKEISIKDLAAEIATILGYTGQILWDITKPNGQMRRCLDVSEAKKRINFEAKTSLHEALDKTIQWYLTQRLS